MPSRNITLHFLKPQHGSAVPWECGHESAGTPSIMPIISRGAEILLPSHQAQGGNRLIQCRGQLALLMGWLAWRGVWIFLECREAPGDGKGLEHGGGLRELHLLAPAARHESGLQNMNSPCHIARVSVTSSAGYGYMTRAQQSDFPPALRSLERYKNRLGSSCLRPGIPDPLLPSRASHQMSKRKEKTCSRPAAFSTTKQLKQKQQLSGSVWCCWPGTCHDNVFLVSKPLLY